MPHHTWLLHGLRCHMNLDLQEANLQDLIYDDMGKVCLEYRFFSMRNPKSILIFGPIGNSGENI